MRSSKKNFLRGSVLAATVFALSSLANDSGTICKQKRIQYGSRFVSCGTLADWGTPLAADFHSKTGAPMTAPPSTLVDENGDRTYYNDYSRVKDTAKNLDQGSWGSYTDPNTGEQKHVPVYGVPLANEFFELVKSQDAQGKTPDSQMGQTWAADYLNQKIQDDSPMQDPAHKNGWIGGWGGCENWSAMATDPHLQKLLEDMKIFGCDSFTFERGPLKDLFVALMPNAINLDTSRAHSGGPFNKIIKRHDDNFDEENIAYSKMGGLGDGNTRFDDVEAMIRNAAASGKGMMIEKNMALNPDRDTEIWNQPLGTVIEVVYKFEDGDKGYWDSVSSIDLASTTNDKFNARQNLAAAEMSFTYNLPIGRGANYFNVCKLQQADGEACESDQQWNSRLLTDQIRIVRELKEKLVEGGILAQRDPQNKLEVFGKELILEYGEENHFGSNVADYKRLTHKTISATTVQHSFVDGNGNVRVTEQRSSWRPKTASLKSVCADHSIASERLNDSNANSLDIDQKCKDLKEGKVSGETQMFTQMLPPGAFKSFDHMTEDAWNSPEGLERYMPKGQAHALFDLDHMIRSNCGKGGKDPRNEAAKFTEALDTALESNSLSGSELASLKERYPDVKPWLTNDWIEQTAAKYNRSSLKKTLHNAFD